MWTCPIAISTDYIIYYYDAKLSIEHNFNVLCYSHPKFIYYITHWTHKQKYSANLFGWVESHCSQCISDLICHHLSDSQITSWMPIKKDSMDVRLLRLQRSIDATKQYQIQIVLPTPEIGISYLQWHT